MSFRWAGESGFGGCRGCGPLLVAQGEVTDASPSEFRAFVRGAKSPVVLLDSEGGKIVAGLQLGEAFRAARVTAIVAREGPGGATSPGVCFSSCIYALIGAAQRVVAAGSQIGVHRMVAHLRGGRHYATSEMIELLRRHSRRMGVSDELVAASEAIPPETMRILTREELKRWRVLSAGS